MISIHLFVFVALSLTLSDYFTCMATRWEQDGRKLRNIRAGKQLQFGMGRGRCPSVVRWSHPNVDSGQTAVRVKTLGGREKLGKEKFGEVLA